jgi:protein involved in polysaccharide export with SLBB domain
MMSLMHLRVRVTRSRGVIGSITAFAIVLPLGVPVCAQTNASAPSFTMTEEPLMPGDAIRLAFWREPGLSGQYSVDEAGVVVLPLLGARDVTGVPGARVKQELADAYGRELANQEVQILLLRRVRILGAVKVPAGGCHRVGGWNNQCWEAQWHQDHPRPK